MGEGNRKDIRNAVEAAHAAFPGWGKRAAHNRAQIVYYMAENLEIRREEFAKRISDMTGQSLEEGLKEVRAGLGLWLAIRPVQGWETPPRHAFRFRLPHLLNNAGGRLH